MLTKSKTNKKERPIKILQFGEGNFLRGFVDYMVDIANEKGEFDGDIIIVKPRDHGDLSQFKVQDCQYTVSLRGLINGKATIKNRIITSISEAISAYKDYDTYSLLSQLDTLRYIVSNTTEAGIVYEETDEFDMKPPKSFPGKVAQFLYKRYKFFNGSSDKGLIILPVELIDENGLRLKEIIIKHSIKWNLEDEFRTWLEESCVFCSTLVDRIITGFPKNETDKLWNEWGYKDELIVTGEPYASWIIESPIDISSEFKLDKANLPVVYTKDLKPYKQRKVRILNGSHTSFVLASFLAGNDIVLESMNDKTIFNFINDTIFDEIIPSLNQNKDELIHFASDVIERFKNPYVKHELLSIALNSVSKWRARCLPSFISFVELNKKLPKHLTFSLAALMQFYKGKEIRNGALIGHRNGVEYTIRDDFEVLKFFSENCEKPSNEFANNFLSKIEFFGQDLTKIDGLVEEITKFLDEINEKGMRKAIEDEFN